MIVNKNRFIVIIKSFLCILNYYGQAQPAFPLKISDNGSYFITWNSIPFLYRTDTGWLLFSRLTKKEAVEYLSYRKSQGFNTIQTMVVFSLDSTNRFGERPFLGNNDYSQPNESYHNHIAELINIADCYGPTLDWVLWRRIWN